MKHDSKCKLAMVIGRLETLHTLNASGEIAHIIGASLADLRDIFADEQDGLLAVDKDGKFYFVGQREDEKK
jgi:hypothetical protein